MPERPLQHRDPDKKDDDTLRKEARAHLASEPALQLVAELIARLRELELPWWTPVRLRERWGAVERLRWFRERPDLRQRITSSLTGLAPKAGRRKAPDFQGSLIDSVIDDGDIPVRTFEEAFQPFELAVYGPAGAYWNFFREVMPWDQDTQVHHDFMTWLLKALLADRSPFDGIGRTPILTAWDVRTAIDGRVWHTRMPLEIRVAIDEARLQQERDRSGVPFHAEGDLSIAVPEIIAASIPLRDLIPVLNAAQKSMRFEAPRIPTKLEGGDPGIRPPERVSPTTPPPPLSSGPPTMANNAPTAPPPPHIAYEPAALSKPPGSPGPIHSSFDPGAGLESHRGNAPPPGSGIPGTKPGAGPMPPPLVPPGSFQPPPMVSGMPPGGPGVPPGGPGMPPGGPGMAPGGPGGPSGGGGMPPGGPGGPPGGPGGPPSGSGGPPSGGGGPPGGGGGPPGGGGGPPGGGGGPPSGSGGPPRGGAAPPGGNAAKASAENVAPSSLVDPVRVTTQPDTIAGRSNSSSGGPGSGGRSGGSPGTGAAGLLAVLTMDPEDEFEMTNPYSVPTQEEIAAESARLQAESASKRRPKA